LSQVETTAPTKPVPSPADNASAPVKIVTEAPKPQESKAPAKLVQVETGVTSED
jgi:hypothetical protein